MTIVKATHISELIPGTMESVEAQRTTLSLPPKNRQWLARNIGLKTAHNQKLVELEGALWEFCAGLSRAPLSGHLLVVYGENGTGKTHGARSVVRWARRSNIQFMPEPNVSQSLCARTEFWSWPELLDALKNGGWDIVADLIESSLLVLDDLGAGHDPTMVGTDKLCQILSRRERKWTLITTNITPTHWESKFDRRIASRFFRNSTIVDLSGVPDYSSVCA